MSTENDVHAECVGIIWLLPKVVGLMVLIRIKLIESKESDIFKI